MSVSALTNSLTDSVNHGVVEVFENQKRVEEAARALVNLAVDDDNKVAIAQAGGVMPLITCLSPRRAYYV